MKENYQKALIKLSLFFLLNPVPFNGQNYQKQKRPGTSDLSFFRLQNNCIISITRYVLSDLVWWCNIKWLLSFSKIKSANSYKPIHDIINYSASICSFEPGKRGIEGKKLHKFEYFKNKKSFFDGIKNIFYSFWMAII